MVYSLMICAGSLLFMAAILLAAWWFAPRLDHARMMQSPEAAAEAEHRAALRRYELARQELYLEERAAEIDRTRAETDMTLRVVRLAEGESAFTVDGNFYHAPKEPRLIEAQAQAQQLGAPLPELMPMLAKCDNILIVARRGAGKSNLIRRIIDARQHVTVLDPHASPQQWGHHQVIGAGLDHSAIEHHLHETVEVQRRNRYKQLGQGVTEFPAETFAIDEMTEVTSEVDVAAPVQRLLNCRKINMTCVVGGHSMNAKDIGLNGKFNLLKNFDAVIKIDYNKATEERRYWLCLQPQTHHDEFIETANPGVYVPPVQPRQPTPHAASEPSAEPSAVVPGRYKGREAEVAMCVIKGMSKTKTREAVTGSNAEIGALYDRIKQELEAAAEPQRVQLQKPAPPKPPQAAVFVPHVTGESKPNGEVMH